MNLHVFIYDFDNNKISREIRERKMVLHNNKWDRKAKFKYLKKHGLLPNKQEQEQPKEVRRKYTKNRPEESSSSSSEEEIEAEVVEGPSEDPYKDGIMLTKQKPQDTETSGPTSEPQQQNNDDIESSGIKVSLLDGAAEKELNTRVRDLNISDLSDDDEEEFIKYSNLTKNINHSYDLKKPIRDEALVEAINDVKNNKKKLQDLDFAMLAKLDFDNLEGKKQEPEDGKNVVKFFSEKESEDLKTMLKEAEKQKLYRKIKMKMESKNKSTRSSSEDNGESKEKMNEFLGLNSTSLDKQVNHKDILDDLLSSSSSAPTNKKDTGLSNSPVSKKPVKKMSCIDDDNKILDDLLGL